jgi:hypothetical protein
MINAHQIRSLIIKPALIDLVMYSEDAEELLMFTCAAESNGGQYLKQIKGPALGIYQMEPSTYNDIWQNYIKEKTNVALVLLSNFEAARMPSEDRLIYDLRFATAMARLHYARIPEKLPGHLDVVGIWEYYKKYYNTAAGSAQQDLAIAKYVSFTSP